MTTLHTEQNRSFAVGTATVRVKVEAVTTGGRFSLVEWTIPPGTPTPPRHVHHEASETFYVIEGELEFPGDHGALRAPAGTCFHVPPGTVHTLANPGPATARALELFSPGDLMGLLEEVGRIFAEGPPVDHGHLQAAFQRHHSSLVGVA